MKRYLGSLVFWLLAVVTAAWVASLVFQPTDGFQGMGLLMLLLLYPFQLLFFLVPLLIGLLALLNWAKGKK